MLYLSLSLELDSPRVKSPNNVYLFWLLTTFVLSFVLSSNNKNSFAGLHASRKCQLCTDYSGGKIQMTKFDSETTYLFGNENVANIFLTISDLYKCFKIVLDCFLVHENMKKQSSKVAHNS